MTFRRTEVVLDSPIGAPVEALLSWLPPEGGPAPAFKPRKVDLFFIPPQPWDLEWIEEINAAFPEERPRCSLLLRGEQPEVVDYALLRRLQNWNWKIVFCESADRLSGLIDGSKVSRERAHIEAAIELARKFRIEVDYFLSLPVFCSSAKDADQLFRFFAVNKVRLVSFARQLLLRNYGVPFSTEVTEESVAVFYRSFVSHWLHDRSAFYLEDIHAAYDLVTGSHSGGADPERAAGPFFVTREAVFQGVLAPVPQMKISDAPLSGRPASASPIISACQRECEYFGICGGAFASERFLYNNSLASARNPYCRSVFAVGAELMLNDAANG